MLFNSLDFIYFFIIVTLLYYLLPHAYRWLFLLLASCYFYMAFLPIYILILAGTIIIDYFAALWIENSQGKKRKWCLYCSLLANIGVLAVFKYYNFFNYSLTIFLQKLGIVNHLPTLSILLPIGLSFHTFQAMSYTIEVYRGNFKAEKHFGIYALYVMFYPQLVAGPIERPQNILHQFYEKKQFSYANIADGLKLMTWGFFKKLVISDTLARIVDQVYNEPQQFKGLPLIIGTVCFAFQIYCDFSGYSDIAIGAAKTMGFNLMTNFNKPYFAKSVTEFWKRWHISLSTWFRDYLYIPLGGNKAGVGRRYFNLLVVFLISGLWHGANWTYIVWGGINAVFAIANITTIKNRKKIKLPNSYQNINNWAGRLTTFILISIGWIFFRSNNVHDAIYICRNLLSSSKGTNSFLESRNLADLLFAGCSIFLLLFVEFKQRHSFLEYINTRKSYWRWSFYYLLIMLIILLGQFNGQQQFIYFQF